MKPEHLRVAWQAYYDAGSVATGIDPLLIRNMQEAQLAAASQRSPAEVAEVIRELAQSVGIDRDSLRAFYDGVDGQIGSTVKSLEEPFGQLYDVAFTTGAYAGLVVGLLAAREAGDYKQEG